MDAVKPESPIVIEEILTRWGWRVTYKDQWVCAMDNPKDKKARPICIPQEVGVTGTVSQDIMNQILFDAKLDSMHYHPIRAIVLGDVPDVKA